jgi:hypothetical protein
MLIIRRLADNNLEEQMMRIKTALSAAALSLVMVAGGAALAQVQLDNDTAEKLTALGVDTSLVVDEEDVGYINQILASDADDTTKHDEIMKLLEEN